MVLKKQGMGFAKSLKGFFQLLAEPSDKRPPAFT